MRYCKCKIVGIDHTDLYTRFIGTTIFGVNIYDENKKLVGTRPRKIDYPGQMMVRRSDHHRRSDDDKIEIMGPRFFECLKCHDFVYCKPGGTLRKCKQGCIKIDHTDVYTRFLGDPYLGVKVYDEDKKFIEAFP